MSSAGDGAPVDLSAWEKPAPHSFAFDETKAPEPEPEPERAKAAKAEAAVDGAAANAVE